MPGSFGSDDSQDGVVGTCNTGGKSGVFGFNPAGGGNGVAGISQDGNGVFGKSSSLNGVFGESDNGSGVHGRSNNQFGVYAFSGQKVAVSGRKARTERASRRHQIPASQSPLAQERGPRSKDLRTRPIRLQSSG